MPLRYLLDTNTASYVIKGNPPQVRTRLLKVPIADIAVSVITEAELRFGVLKFPAATRLKIVVEEFLRMIDIRAWDSGAAQSYAQLRAALEQQGRPIGNLDLMIAAHALSLGVVLVSSERVFGKVQALQVQDWTR